MANPTSKNKPTHILPILDLALEARRQGRKFTPLFSGDAGLGKSEICQQWVAEQQKRNPNFFFIDLRLAYMEAPDFIGLPKIVGENRTSHILPEFWPSEGEGLLLLEEPNRANSSVMNCMMQLLTDRKVHNYKLPDGVITAGCINEGGTYDVNDMDTALRDRFEIYPIGYDFKTFLAYAESNKWHGDLLNFIKAGVWIYKSPEELGDDGHYISPRTLSKLNTALKSGVEKMPEIYYNTIQSILGKNVGREYYKFVSENRPVLAQDFVENEKDAFKRLEKICDKEGYRGDLIEILNGSLADNYETSIDDEIILKVVKLIPKDQAVNLLRSCVLKSKQKKDLEHFIKLDPTLKATLKEALRG